MNNHYSIGEDVLAWERQVDSRGWRIHSIDGAFDAETGRVCRALQQFKGPSRHGEGRHQTWDAAWIQKVPVTA